ncbi:hypothetical protein IFR09_05960 [Pseudomonas syringae]|nr:hypothetical protein [Pseudomonas syringae]MBD8574712.1 hypothetical protein [Pseudomonas syringae]MBD8789275.1 hypothetical protein [Pseudomonas syringae]MBD8800281.1 hypothetical protein [Pseudomonas syringae]MBD8810703.1 hypothetical protein [Pseudomonas syringae]
MNRFVQCLGLTLLLAGATSASAQSVAGADRGASSNPYNSPIKRANPNSRQGTAPATPQGRTPGTAPTPRPPTLENGGIGNGYPSRQQTPPRPATDPRPSTPTRGN